MKEGSVDARSLRRREPQQESRTVIQLGSDFYIHASSLTSRRATRVLVNGESFAVFEVGGDILESPLEPLGFFHRDTRYLSRFELKIAGETPYYLNSDSSREKAQLRINLSNPDLGFQAEAVELPHNSIQLERNWVIAGAVLFHKVVVRNYARLPVEIPLDFLFGVDFADLFEVRGFKRSRRGSYDEPQVAADRVRFAYRGLDDQRRVTEIVLEPAPIRLGRDRASFLFTLKPDEQRELEVRIAGECVEVPVRRAAPVRFEDALSQRRGEIAQLDAGWSKITASHEPLDSLLRRSSADLTTVIQFAPEGTFLMAGIPWFATLFGRDSILTALSVLPFNPALSVGTLKTLAGLQGSEVNATRDEQPGKIVHEIRGGELAATGEVPFGRYYGTVDATPLFLWLLGRYVATTGDLGLAEQLWNNVERAFQWIEQWGDRDGDMYVEYLRETPRGLANQGWKDSFDAISHSDGTLARPPIALCEVQGYVYAAYSSIAEVALRLGRQDTAARLNQRAAALKSRFERDFWLERVRTLGVGERRYNPMSYHNGSVWPHDNALVAAGLASVQERRGVLRILEGLLQAAAQFNTGSLPELFCGFPRDQLLGPVPYPVACHPQAWSAASIFMIVQAMLGFEVMGFERKLVIDSPVMPEWLEWLKIENLKIGDGAVSLLIRRSPEVPAIEILEKHGPITVEIR